MDKWDVVAGIEAPKVFAKRKIANEVESYACRISQICCPSSFQEVLTVKVYHATILRERKVRPRRYLL